MKVVFISFGVVAELITKQALFPGDSELQQLLHIFKFSEMGFPVSKSS